MGCDIYVHTEVKINGKWEHVGNPPILRDYELFAKMAGVRQREPRIDPIAEPRGVPEDASFLTKFDLQRDPGHSASWLSGEEIDALDEWYRNIWTKRNPNQHHYIEKEFGFLFGNGWNVKAFTEDNPPGVEDARWIFWFDN
jgi:hypothetical protein